MQNNNENIRQYFKYQIQPIFEQLITQIAKKRPEDIIEYALKYFKNTQPTQDQQQEDDPFLHDQINQIEFKKIRKEKLECTIRKKRIAVSSQANLIFNPARKPISLRKAGIKQQRTQIMIKFYFSNTFLFKDFDEQQKNSIIESMVQQKTQVNQIVITQGQYGDCMYFIEQGFFECSLKETRQDKKKNVHFLKNYQAGDTFGQLSLLHSAKRQATVISKTQGTLYLLSRQFYTQIHKMSIGKRRSSYIQKLMNVNIFSNLTSQDFQKLCDLLKEMRYQPGNYIIYQGDMGNKFFIVIEGLLVAKNNAQQTFYQYYKEGDYFGQLALINKRPRQLSVQAVTKCRLVSLTSQVFLNVINKDKASIEIRNKYKDAKPITNLRKKKNTIDV